MNNTKAKIYLAEERGHTETEWYRSYNTFWFGDYRPASKIPFGHLYLCNDDVLAGGRSLKLNVEKDSDIILLPTVGAVQYKDSLGNESIIAAGEAQISSLPGNSGFEISNPYETELVNYLQLWIEKPLTSSPGLQQCSFDLDKNKNILMDLFTAPQNAGIGHTSISKICLGKFMGREEAVYKSSYKPNGIFVFVIEGAFEVCNRLMETRDGLAIWNTDSVEMEALSNNALVLVLEIRIHGS